MNLEQMTEIAWFATRPGPSSQPTSPGCLGGIIANQTITNNLCSQINIILPVAFVLVPLLILLRVLSSFLTYDEPHSRNDTLEDDKGDSFLHRLFYRRKKKREEDG